jgi:hypothetical protein
MTLVLDGPAAWELPNSILSSLIAIVASPYRSLLAQVRMESVAIDVRFGQARAR